ncbi:unnamed protein product [Amoebophrya sp. A25]|nr:unnamed protein product [Amoebophrya sp. A25]|eukprot:GSA25T00022054001.1
MPSSTPGKDKREQEEVEPPLVTHGRPKRAPKPPDEIIGSPKKIVTPAVSSASTDHGEVGASATKSTRKDSGSAASAAVSTPDVGAPAAPVRTCDVGVSAASPATPERLLLENVDTSAKVEKPKPATAFKLVEAGQEEADVKRSGGRRSLTKADELHIAIPAQVSQHSITSSVEAEEEIELDHSRWRSYYLVGVFCYLQLLTGMILNGFFTIVEQVAQFYQVSEEMVNIMGTVIYLLAALKFPAMYWVERVGVVPGLSTGLLFLTIGSVGIRLFGMNNFTLVFVGTVVAQIGQPFFQCLAASIAVNYFPANKRATPTALGIASDTTGVGVGMFLCGLPMFSTDPRNWIVFTAGLNVIGIVLFVPIFLCFQNRGARKEIKRKELRERRGHELQSVVATSPPHPTPGLEETVTITSTGTSSRISLTGSNRTAHQAEQLSPRSERFRVRLCKRLLRFPLFRSIYVLFAACPEFVYCFTGISILFGVFNAHLSVISEVFPPYASGNIYAGLFFLAGLVGNVLQGSFLDAKLLTHAEMIRAAAVAMGPLFGFTAFVWTTGIFGHAWVMYTLACLMGVGGPGLAATTISFVINCRSYQRLNRQPGQPETESQMELRALFPELTSEAEQSGPACNLESTLTGLMLLGFCLVTAVLNLVLNPATLGPTFGGDKVLPWIWLFLALPGFWCLFRATSLPSGGILVRARR